MVSFLYFHFCNGIDPLKKKKNKKLEYPAHILMGFFLIFFKKGIWSKTKKKKFPLILENFLLLSGFVRFLSYIKTFTYIMPNLHFCNIVRRGTSWPWTPELYETGKCSIADTRIYILVDPRIASNNTDSIATPSSVK